MFKNTKYIQVITILRCKNTKYIQSDFIYIYTLIFVPLTGEEKYNGKSSLIQLQKGITNNKRIFYYFFAISPADLLFVYFFSSVSFGNSRMKDCYHNALEKQNHFSYDFNESLSKFPIKNNPVVILTVEPDETFIFVSYNISTIIEMFEGTLR